MDCQSYVNHYQNAKFTSLRKDHISVHVNLSCLYFYSILLKLSIYSFAGFLIICYVITATVLAIIT